MPKGWLRLDSNRQPDREKGSNSTQQHSTAFNSTQQHSTALNSCDVTTRLDTTRHGGKHQPSGAVAGRAGQGRATVSSTKDKKEQTKTTARSSHRTTADKSEKVKQNALLCHQKEHDSEEYRKRGTRTELQRGITRTGMSTHLSVARQICSSRTPWRVVRPRQHQTPAGLACPSNAGRVSLCTPLLGAGGG